MTHIALRPAHSALRIAFLSLVVAGAVACSGTIEPADDAGDGGATGDGDSGSTGDGDGGGAVMLGNASLDGSEAIQPCGEGGPEDQIDVKGVEISGSSLTIEYGHGGGCEDHTYALCYAREWAESEPVQIGLRLLHDAHGDTCEAYLGGTMLFDLTPLEEAYEDAYRSDSGRISLSLQDERFTHSFGTPAPTWEEIETVIDELNTCEVVDDCQAIPTTPCEKTYINAGANSSELEEMIDAYNRSNGDGGDFACTDDCQCGVLSCDAGKCVTGNHDCESEPENGQTICL